MTPARLPLDGVTVVVTRPPGQGDRLAARLSALGARVALTPLLVIGPPADWSAADAAIAQLDSFDWVAFTSANGVRGLMRRIVERGRAGLPGGVKVAAVGPATRECVRSFGVGVDVMPAEFNAPALAAALRPVVAGQRVLLGLGEAGRDALRAGLAGVAEVTSVCVYRQEPADAAPFVAALAGAGPCYVVATSPNLARLMGAVLPPAARAEVLTGRLRLVTISGLTSSVLHELGWPVAVQADSADDDGVVAALLADAGGQRS